MKSLINQKTQLHKAMDLLRNTSLKDYVSTKMTNDTFYAPPPLEKGGILFCNCRSVGRYVGRSVGL